jgi:uncharacterized RDD family membrane protein YckC
MMEEQIEITDSVERVEMLYPGVFERIKAAVTDSFVIIAFMLILTIIFSKFQNVPDSLRIAGFIFIFILYDPLFTSLFGGTIGHMIMKIQVKRISNPEKNILLPMAIIRFIVKLLLGWISFLTVLSNDRHLAIHDMIAGSIVLHKTKSVLG